jgi:hypothetical protein
LNANDEAAFRTLGVSMASTNGFTPEQASDLYIADGTIDDWLWGAHRIFGYTFEMYPRSASQGGFYPPASVITAQTTRNREAVLRLLDAADCPYEVINRQDLCGIAPAPTVYSDNFETAAGNWVRNAGGTDTATTGLWQRADPAATSSNGAKQLGTTTSGTFDLVTGASGGDAGANDIDGGTTTIRSQPIALPSSGNLTLSFAWYLAHGSNSSSADFFRVRVNNTQVFQQLGAATNRNGAWATANVNLSAFAGQTVTIQFEAADASTASLVEAGVDDVRITR